MLVEVMFVFVGGEFFIVFVVVVLGLIWDIFLLEEMRFCLDCINLICNLFFFLVVFLWIGVEEFCLLLEVVLFLLYWDDLL